jgi:signal peptidase I
MDLASKDLTQRVKKAIFWIIGVGLILSVGIMVFLFTAKISIFAISGSSMEPLLQDRDSVVIRQEKNVERDQIFVFDMPRSWKYADENKTLIKRVAAVPGDLLEYDGQSFFVNGEPIYHTSQEGFKYECEAGEEGYSHILTKSEIFALGDNAPVSLDSRRIFCDGDSKNMYIQQRNMVDYGNIILKF